MKNKEIDQRKCGFILHPSNFEVKIKEVKPFHVCAYKYIILDLNVITPCNIKSNIRIKSTPKHGKLYFLSSSSIIYKPIKSRRGLDFFQILIEDECGGKHTETIFIHVV